MSSIFFLHINFNINLKFSSERVTAFCREFCNDIVFCPSSMNWGNFKADYIMFYGVWSPWRSSKVILYWGPNFLPWKWYGRLNQNRFILVWRSRKFGFLLTFPCWLLIKLARILCALIWRAYARVYRFGEEIWNSLGHDLAALGYSNRVPIEVGAISVRWQKLS